MSFFKKLTDEFKELKTRFEDKPEGKRKEVKSAVKTDESKPVDASHEAVPDLDGQFFSSYQQPACGQPPEQYGQQQQYPPPPPQHSSPPGQPPPPPGWMAQFDQNLQRWYYVEQATGRTQWEIPQQSQHYSAPPPQDPSYTSPPPPHSGYASPPPPGGYGYGQGPPSGYNSGSPGAGYSGERGNSEGGGFHDQYGGAQHADPGQNDYQHQQNAQQYYGDAEKVEKKDDKDQDKSKDKRNILLAGGAGLAVGGVAGAVIAHDSDSDDGHHSSTPAPAAYAAAPVAYDPSTYASDPYGSQGYGYGAPAPPVAHDSDPESLHEAQKDYNQAVEAAAHSNASSDELEDLQEARRSLEKEREEYREE